MSKGDLSELLAAGEEARARENGRECMRDDNPNGELSIAVLRLLFQDARSWWYHRCLREQGMVADARRRERHAVCRHVDDLRQATMLHVGAGGWTLYRDQGRLEGHGGMEDLFVQAALAAGVPVLDSTEAADATVRALVKGPCAEDEPVAALHYAQALGARVYNASRPGDSEKDDATGLRATATATDSPEARREGHVRCDALSPQCLSDYRRQEMSRRIPAFTTGVDVWGYFATNLYSHGMLPIVLRELFQNSRDSCRQIGQDPEISIVVRGDETFKYGHIVCQDNGCGMDEDAIIDELLCLGATNKGLGATGGFGIAKAVILGGCTWWEVQTNQLYLSLDHLRERRPIEEADQPRQGTRVLLRYDPLPKHDPRHHKLRFSSWDLAEAISWLAHCDTPCAVDVYVGQQLQRWRLDGLRTGPETVVAEGQKARTRWQLHQIPALDVEPFRYTSHRGVQRTRRVDSAGRLFVRLSGLVQFTKRLSNHPDAWVLDVETEARAQDADYPFSLSRETLSDVIEDDVDAALEPHHRNPLTSHRRQFRANDCPKTMYYAGRWLGREEETQHQRAADVDDATLRASAFRQATQVVGGDRRSPLGFQVQIKGVDRTGRNISAPHNLRLLAAWAQVVELIVLANKVEEQFGVGFVFDADTFAERVSGGRGVFYLINPRAVRLASSRPDETLIKMFVHAGHEVAHSRYDHGEHHSSYMGELLNRAAAAFAAEQRRLARELSGRDDSPLIERLQMELALS
ncbi:MAG: ATP-binding protein [Armatimonadota bacterium]|nr:ATP-binding protein [Armatimonadota bacterium]